MNGLPREPVQVYRTRITHIRRTPWRRSFSHRSWMWITDIDVVVPARGLAAQAVGFFRGRLLARDHLDGRPGTLREALVRFAEREGLDLSGGRVLLAAQPRSFGFCFNPISVWWCLDDGGDLRATVVEVHNTYGDRHAYVLEPAADGRATVDKAMYVSPFHGVDGNYEVIAPVPRRRLEVSVTLHTDSAARFSAALTGRRVADAPWWALLATSRDAIRIRVHGIKLWARRLPVQPRPIHHQEALR